MLFRSSIAGPIYLHDLTGLVIQVHGGIGLGQIVGIILVELGGLVWDLARCSALVAVFQPEQIQGDATALELLMYIGVVRHLVDGQALDGNRHSESCLSDISSGSGHCKPQFAAL